MEKVSPEAGWNSLAHNLPKQEPMTNNAEQKN
ncbi:hypothetical protein J2T20_004605 [Paenibacillus wynnii]|nr:hypothetical protein [Paenibacillus wynnii]